MTEPASVVAARQLAEEAWARWSTIECATSVVTSDRTPHSVRTRRARAALLAVAAAATAGCDGPPTVCSAVGYGSVLVVELAPDWSVGPVREVEFDCDPACVTPLALEQATPDVVPSPGTAQTSRPSAPSARTTEVPVDPVVEVGSAGEASVVLYDGRPDEVAVRVLEGGVVVAELTAEPEFVRVDGTEECGGNTEARVVVPAP